MKEIIEVILQNFIYIYPGFIFWSIYQYISGNSRDDINLFFLKIVCVSYIIVEIIGAILGVIFEIIELSDRNIMILANNMSLLFVSIILPFWMFRISKAKIFMKFLRWNNIPIETSKNVIEMIERKRPKDNIVYITIFLKDVIYTGVLADAEFGENGFFYLKHWKKYIIDSQHIIYSNDSVRQRDTYAIIPSRSVNHYYYEYIFKNTKKLPDKII